MKLLITTDNFLPQWDGIARFLNEILPRLKGYEITVIAPNYGEIKAHGFTLVQLPLGKKAFGGYIPATFQYRKIKKLVKEADVVFNQTLGPIGICAIHAAKNLNKPVISFTHSLEWELFTKSVKNSFLLRLLYPFVLFLVRFLYNRCSLLIVPSKITAEQLSRKGVRTKKRIVHLGVDIEKFSPVARGVARKELGLRDDAFIIGYHGRISREKNLITLLRAFLRVDIPRKKLLIVGDGVDEIKNKLKKPGVVITGMQSDVRKYLHTMDVYVLPSLTETTSLSVLEAMACGLPVISTRVGFINEYIKDKENGFFFKQRDPFDLARKIQRVHDLSMDEKKRVSAAARATVVQGFRWKRTAQEITQIIQSFEKK